MGSHSKTFRPTQVTARYSTISVENAGRLTDSSLTTFGSFLAGTTNPVAAYFYYNFSSLPDVNATLQSVNMGNTNCKVYGGGKYQTYLWLHGIINSSSGTKVEDTWAYSDSDVRFYYASSSSIPTSSSEAESFNRNATLDVYSLASSAAFTYAQLRSLDAASHSPIYFSFGVRRNTSYGTKTYLNDLPVVVNYSLPDYTVTFNSTAGGSASVSSATGDVITSVSSTASTPDSGYSWVGWKDGGGNVVTTDYTLTVTPTANVTYTATYKYDQITATFKDYDGRTVSTQSVAQGGYVTAPTLTRTGYDFIGWIPSNNGPVCDSYEYGGSDFHIVPRTYMYTNLLSIRIDAYMDDWSKITNRQIMSCTESGGWGIGYQANTVGHGAEVYTGSYSGIDFGLASLSEGWHTFEVRFSAGTFQGYVDGTLKGSVVCSATSITYHSSNVIFVGAEAGSSASTPGGNYFNGIISNVFIENSASRMQTSTGTFRIINDVTYYPLYYKQISYPEIRGVTITPNPANAEQGFIISVDAA